MSQIINIGLDFGTHQTKVCIENSTDPRNITYTFMKFYEGTISETYFFPSIVQVNKDDTISYGKFDNNTAKCIKQNITKGKKPKLILPEVPKKERYPVKPNDISIISFNKFQSNQINKIVSIEENRLHKSLRKDERKKLIYKLSTQTHDINHMKLLYQRYVDETRARNRKQYNEWKIKVDRIDDNYRAKVHGWKQKCCELKSDYEKELRRWEKPTSNKKYQIYRYFKIASFSKHYEWNMDIDPITVSIWYITYVLFQIYKVVDKSATVQMGIPQSISDVSHSKLQIKNAERIFYSAYRLYSSYEDEKEFLNAKVSQLLERTKCEFIEPDYNIEPGLLVLPEAFASLITLTKEGKINRGLSLLMDIGGGSTDISLFNVINRGRNTLPNISHILSIHKGLNHLFKSYFDDHDVESIEDVRILFQGGQNGFSKYVDQFCKDIAKDIQESIYSPLIEASQHSGINSYKVKDALQGRPVIYTGGGGVFDILIRRIHVFTDPMSISKDFISLKNITNKNLTDIELSILSVSYGLSVAQIKEPEMTPLKNLFDHIKIILGEKNNYEHGITDVE